MQKLKHFSHSFVCFRKNNFNTQNSCSFHHVSNFLAPSYIFKAQSNIVCHSSSDDMNADIFDTKSRLSAQKNGGQNTKGAQQIKNRSFGFLNSFQNQNRSFNQNSNFSETTKQQVVSITYEEIGLFPRSFNRVFDRFFKQLFFDVENLVIQEYRFYRYLFFTTVKCLFILLFVPLSINFFAKNYFIRPITEYYWNTRNHEIFLNSYQQKRAFTELKKFEEKIYFESLLFSENQVGAGSTQPPTSYSHQNLSFQTSSLDEKNKKIEKNDHPQEISTKQSINKSRLVLPSRKNTLESDSFTENSFDTKKYQISDSTKTDRSGNQSTPDASLAFSMTLQKRFQMKIYELAKHYNEESIEAVTNFFADVLSFTSLCFLLFRLEIQINITKSFLLEVFFGLDDSKKSLLILFVTDLLVGYHSPNIWELFFQTIFDHYGLPESQTTIFLLVATLPVLLDVLFKYLIFRHLNRASPATVATYHAMIE